MMLQEHFFLFGAHCPGHTMQSDSQLEEAFHWGGGGTPLLGRWSRACEGPRGAHTDTQRAVPELALPAPKGGLGPGPRRAAGGTGHPGASWGPPTCSALGTSGCGCRMPGRGGAEPEKPDREAGEEPVPGQHATCPGGEGTSRRRGAGSQQHSGNDGLGRQSRNGLSKRRRCPGAQAARPPKALAGGWQCMTTPTPWTLPKAVGQQRLGWFWRRSV